MNSTFLAVLLAIALSAGNAQATVISFEDGTLGPFSIVPGSSGIALVMNATAAEEGTGYTATDGSRFLYLAPDNLTESVTAMFSNVPVGSEISFDWAFLARDRTVRNDWMSITVNGATIILADVASVGSFGDTGWRTFSTIAPSDIVDLTFVVSNATDSRNPSEGLIDNIRFTEATPDQSVPEPTTLGLLGLGLIGLMTIRHRK